MEARLGCSEAVSKKTPRASDKQRRSALGYNLGSSARSCADKANSAMRPQDPPLKTTLRSSLRDSGQAGQVVWGTRKTKSRSLVATLLVMTPLWLRCSPIGSSRALDDTILIPTSSRIGRGALYLFITAGLSELGLA